MTTAGLSQSYDRGTTDVPLIEQTIGDFFDAMAARQPQREALVSAHQKRRYSYAALAAEARKDERIVAITAASLGAVRINST